MARRFRSNGIGRPKGVKSYQSSTPDISDNGNFIVFQSMDNLLKPTDSNGSGDTDIYLYNKSTGILNMVSGAANGSLQGSNNGFEADSANAGVSNDGRFVVFESSASNLVSGDSNGQRDIFLQDMVTANFYLLSMTSTGQPANSSSGDAAMTPDAHYVVFSSSANNLVTGNSSSNGVYRVDISSGEILQVNTTAAGVAVGGAFHPEISADGRYVVFESAATNLVPIAGDSNAITKIFVKDMKTGSVAIVSLDSDGDVNAQSAYAPQISDDGQFIVFTTASSLAGGDSNGFTDVYRVTNPVYGSGSNLGNDTFTDSPGSETFAGGSGLDMVVYTGNRDDYSIAKTASGYAIASDNLSEIERLQFWDKSVALDVSATGNAGQAMEFIGTIAPSVLHDLAVRGVILSFFDQEYSMLQLCQLALDVNLVPHNTSAELGNAIYQNVVGTAATPDWTNTLVSYIEQHGQAAFVAAVADMGLNVDLVGLSQTGLEFV